jgi:3-isopropylmalate dehydrogenase
VIVAVAVRGSASNPYRIAVLPGDGAGPSVASVATTVLQGLSDACDLHFEFIEAPYGAGAFDKDGTLVPDETVAVCRGADAVLRSYQGSERGDGRSGSAHKLLLAKLGLFAQLRPVVVYPQLASSSTLRPEIVDGVDMMLVREVSGGALGESGEAYMPDAGLDSARSEVSYTRDAVQRISSVALQIAERRSGRVLNVDKADAMSVSRFWRSELHAYFDEHAKDNEGVSVADMFVDDFVREVMLRPADFDTIVTSNLFGDILAEVMAALSGPLRISPSVWVSRDGLGVYGPADIYNPTAYPTSSSGGAAEPSASPVAMIRSASMMLRYALEEPAAADLIQQALRGALGDTPLGTVSPVDFGQAVIRSLEVMRQFEAVCPPDQCGE